MKKSVRNRSIFWKKQILWNWIITVEEGFIYPNIFLRTWPWGLGKGKAGPYSHGGRGRHWAVLLSPKARLTFRISQMYKAHAHCPDTDLKERRRQGTACEEQVFVRKKGFPEAQTSIASYFKSEIRWWKRIYPKQNEPLVIVLSSTSARGFHRTYRYWS